MRGSKFYTLPLSGSATHKTARAPRLRPPPGPDPIECTRSLLLAEPPKGVGNAEASAAPAQAS
mgnify:CR=1 FL=1